jgi:ABC-2 type transport system permease protein
MLLATFFNMAFGQLGAQENFDPIDTAIVDTGGDEAFMSLVKSLSEGDERLFNITITSKDEALMLLSEGKVKGIIETGDTLSLTVSQGGLSQSILKTFIDSYSQTASSINRIAAQNPEALETVMAILADDIYFFEERPIARANPDSMVIYFYSLIAMTCLFGGFLGANEVNAIQANLSYYAARMNFAPVHKLKMFMSGIIAALIIQFTKLLLVLAYLVFVLSIDFGDRIGLIIFTISLCSILGISFGAFVTSLVKGTEGLKIGILIATGNVSSFLAGMMQAEIKFIIDTNVPILSKINPASLVTDAFYALYYFDTYHRFIENAIGIIILTIIFSASTYFVIRRRKYVSI